MPSGAAARAAAWQVRTLRLCARSDMYADVLNLVASTRAHFFYSAWSCESVEDLLVVPLPSFCLVWAVTVTMHVESSSTTTLEDVTNTPRHSEDGVGGARTSSGLTKQWVRLRQQLAEARQTILAKDSLVSRLHQQLQQGLSARAAAVQGRCGRIRACMSRKAS